MAVQISDLRISGSTRWEPDLCIALLAAHPACIGPHPRETKTPGETAASLHIKSSNPFRGQWSRYPMYVSNAVDGKVSLVPEYQ
ncbi:hypothetical protein BaRGS_00037121 [Batillaria attramentaria]|uniref:Uncharacterized protein n=1 Tax=Batillaria attramentaria TaxID=370345 RepID=A0ABD0J9H5_9CAEN